MILPGARDEVLRAIEKGFTDVDIHVRGTAVTVSGPAAHVDTVVVLLSDPLTSPAPARLTADAVAVGLLETSTRPTEVLTAHYPHPPTAVPSASKSLGQKAYTDAIEESTTPSASAPPAPARPGLAMAKAADALARKRVPASSSPAPPSRPNLGSPTRQP